MSMNHIIQSISAKFLLIDELIDHYYEKVPTTIMPDLNGLVYTMKEIIAISIKNLEILNNEMIQSTFEQILKNIDTISDSIINYITFLADSLIKEGQIIKNSINDLYQCNKIFLANLGQIIDKYSNLESAEMLQNWLGLELFLFSYCVNNQPTKEIPFFNTKIVSLYKSYGKINSIENVVSVLSSFCGTGKTICLPIILLCRSLKENMNMPFFLLSEPNPKKVAIFFKQKISNFVTITTNKDDFLKEFNHFNENKKIVFGIFNPYDFLCLICNPKIIKLSRFVIDEISQRSTITDALFTKIIDFKNENLLTFPLHTVLMSSSISSSLRSLFESSSIELISLCESSQYEIIERQPIYLPFLEKIKSEIVPNEIINIINDMAMLNTEIGEGHILCYLPGFIDCEKAKNTVISSLIDNEETEIKRKIVFLNTVNTSNDSIKDFYEKVRKEYIINEELRENNKYMYDFLYFLPFNCSGLSEESFIHFVENELPKDLNKINKLIFTDTLSDPLINDKLSVVIDSGLIRENCFNYSNSVYIIKDIQASKEVMNLRKGKLGRSMKGLYIPIQIEKNIPEIETPLIQKEDLATNILLLKDIDINIENMKNLPDKPSKENIRTSLDNLIYIGAIDDENMRITEFGRNILQFQFIFIYYAAAMLIFKNEFEEDEENIAFFVGGYISIVITMSNELFREEMSAKLLKFFVKESDIATIINALNFLFKSPINEKEALKSLVESYGFSFTTILNLRSNIQKMIDIIYPTKTITEVLNIANEFIENHDGIVAIIDLFIQSIEQTYPSFPENNYATFKYINEFCGFEGNSLLTFTNFQNSEINIFRRPGWDGISIPTECYLFNISFNLNHEVNNGFLVHRATPDSKNIISTIMFDDIALNPYFRILLEIYFSDLNLTRFEYYSETQRKESYLFHFSNVGDKVYVSFISEEGESIKEKILKGAKKIIKLLPYVPRSVLVLRRDGNAVVEITSYGTQDYNASISTSCKGNLLDKKSIEYCFNNLEELAKLDSRIRICSLFVEESCEKKYFDEKKLYIINELYNNKMPPIIDVVLPRLQIIQDEIKQSQQMNRHYVLENKLKEHKDRYFDKKYRTFVTKKEESEKVYHLIENLDLDSDNGNEVSSFIENELSSKALFCYLSCNNPDDPVLTKLPITVFFKDGSYYAGKVCHDCILENLKYNLNYLFVGGRVDRNKVEGIMMKPNVIPSTESIVNEQGSESWPIIPLGLMIYVLINDEIELSSFISAWLYSVEEFTIRVMMRNRFIWCNRHTHTIFDIVKLGNKLFHCKDCENEIASMQPDEVETLKRKEEMKLQDIENRVFQEVEQQIRQNVEEKMERYQKAHQGMKIKNRQQQEDTMRKKFEFEIRNENYEVFRNDVLNAIEQEEKRKIAQEKRQKELEENKRKEDERIRRIEEERIRRYEASIQREVDYKINKLIEKQILDEETQTGIKIEPQRRKEIEIEFRKNEIEIKNEVIQERKRLIDEEIKKVNERNYHKNMMFVSKLNTCPNCKRPIIKNGGCNHMHCVCGCYFLWGG
ncbi:hypothetical protein M9Y10_025096 [Tritrichomonas musculus]|uniref:Helicase ATP-binding domain-containing protein n=1 Tax=Tritrichomonas musculus TaxID=1915356 RepID=A0ABR2HAM7_9EUKA